MEKFFADANIGLRILVGNTDIAKASSKEAKEKIQQIVNDSVTLINLVNEGKITLLFEDSVVEEMIFVLDKQYRVSRGKISQGLLLLLEAENVEASSTIKTTLRRFSTTNLDINDIKLSVLSNEHGISILTWDKGFAHLDCENYAPSDIIKKLSEELE
jgi:predicted nucleic-acid-binding protein